MATQEATSIYEVRLAARGDLAGLRFIDPLLRADPDNCSVFRKPDTITADWSLGVIDP